MKMTNNEIYTTANQLVAAFNDNTQRLPIKINFYLQKNKKTLVALAQDIEAARMEIARSYGTLNEAKDQYIIPPENMEKAQKELNDLFDLEQEVPIGKISIDKIDEDLVLSAGQMDALMFMIDG